MVYAHLLEINDIILVLLHLVLYGGNLGCKVLLPLYKSFEHTARHVMSLLSYHFKVILYGIQLRLKYLLLHFRRLRYLAELVMGHYDAVIVIVLDLIEEIDPLVRHKAFRVGEKYAGIGICRLISQGNLGDVGFQTDNHRLIRQPETLHFMCRNAHYQGFTTTHLKIADTPSVLFQHPYAVFLTWIDGVYTITVAEYFHVKVRKSLVAAVVLRTHETVEFVVIQVHQTLLELRRLSLQPFGEPIADFINLGIGELYSLAIRNFYVVSVFILAD